MDPYSIASTAASLGAHASEIAAGLDPNVNNTPKLRPELFKLSSTSRLISNGYEENPGALMEYEPCLWDTIKSHLDCSNATLNKLEEAMNTTKEPRRILGAILSSSRSPSPRRNRDIQCLLHDIGMHLSAAHVILRIIRLALDLKGASSQKTVDRSTESLRMEIKQMNETIRSTPAENKDVLANVERLCNAAKSFYADVVTRPMCPTTNVFYQNERYIPMEAPPSYAEASNTASKAKGAQPQKQEIVMARLNTSHTPTHTAARAGNVEVLKLLHKGGADLSASTEDQESVLCSATYKGHVNAVKFILEHGGDFCTPRKTGGYTPLYIAASHGYFEIVQLLLKWGADVNQAGDNSWTPINIAAEKGHVNIVEILLRHGADPSIATAGHKQTPLYSACRSNHQNVVKILLEHGAK